MIKIDTKQCIGCGKCVRYCVDGNLEMSGNKASVLSECISCGHCLALCPVGAIILEDDAYDVEDVEMIPKDYKPIDSDRYLKMIKYRRSIRNYQNQKMTKYEKKIRICSFSTNRSSYV